MKILGSYLKVGDRVLTPRGIRVVVSTHPLRLK